MLNYVQKFLDRQLNDSGGYDRKEEEKGREGGEVRIKMSHVGRRDEGNS